jgi:uncharacterized radical SAM superfamily Fe-S cluster-containing enzyme
MAGVLMCAFYGLLRPSEFISLARDNILTPITHGMGQFLILIILTPKTRHKGARRQHVRIDEPGVVAYITRLLQSIAHGQNLWPGSAHMFRNRLGKMLTAMVGLPKLIWPSSFRPGGATWLFQSSNENIQKVLWRGRWADVRMLNHYIQELQTVNVIASLTHNDREKVDALAVLYHDLVAETCA